MIEKHNNTSRAAQLNNKRREYCERITIEKSIRKIERGLVRVMRASVG